MSAVTSPALPAFSYAQAAKGITPPSSTKQTAVDSMLVEPGPHTNDSKQPTSEPSNLDIGGKEAGTQIALDEPSQTEHSNEAFASETNENYPQNKRDQSSMRNHSAAREEKSKSVSPLINATSELTPPPSVPDELIAMPKNSSDSNWDVESHVSTGAEKSKTPSENDKELGEDQQSKDHKKKSIEQELKAAPIPTVNVWQVRQREHEASKAVKAGPPRQTTLSASTPAPQIDPGKQAEKSRQASSKASAPAEKEATIVKEKKPSNDRIQSRDDAKRAVRNGRQDPEHKESVTPSAPPPPVGDVKLWPTPENANLEDKKKSQPQDKSEKLESKSPASKPHGKNKWEPVPHVPTVKFNTPLPPVAARRGGKGTVRGGRESSGRAAHVPSASIGGDSGEKTMTMGPPLLPNKDSQRGRVDGQSEGQRATSLPDQTRRASSVDTATAGHRQSVEGNHFERNRSDSQRTSENFASKAAESRNLTETTSSGPRPRQNSRSFGKGLSDVSPSSYRMTTYESKRHQPRPGESRYHSDKKTLQPDFLRDSDSAASKERGDFHTSQDVARKNDFSREKGQPWRDRDPYSERREGRSERGGRGSHRGRGGHSNYGHHFSGAQPYSAPLLQQPFQSSKGTSFGERHRQTSAPYPTPPASQQGQRATPRSQSIPNAHFFPSMPNGMPNLQQPLSPIQTDFGQVYYGPPLYPVPPMQNDLPQEGYNVLSYIYAQLEYYFSTDNLCKDMFLRQRMDSQGYVPLHVVASFKRIKALTEDMDLLRFACQTLEAVDFLHGEDKLRAKGNWQNWILPIEQRDDSAKNAGPVHFAQQSTPDVQNGFSNLPVSESFSANYVNGPAAMAPPFVPASASFDSQIVETPISAGTQDVASKDHAMQSNDIDANGSHGEMTGTDEAQAQMPNGHGLVSKSPYQQENMFTNEQIEKLILVCRKPSSETSRVPRAPFSLAANRTFSNGSIDSQTLVERSRNVSPLPSLRGGAGCLNNLSSDAASRAMSPSNVRGRQRKEPPVLWLKDGARAAGLHDDNLMHEPYMDLVSRVLRRRDIDQESPDDVEILYQFWSHFLVNNFNADMYNKFYELAVADLKRDSNNGMEHLIRYYEEALGPQRVLPNKVASDLVDLAEAELDTTQTIVPKLRKAWRDGAFPLKSRKRIADLISPALKAQLEA